MNTLNQLIEIAKEVPYGESYYKAVICKYTAEGNRTTFTINYQRASKKEVEEYLKQFGK